MSNEDLPAFPYKAEQRVQVAENIEQVTPGDVPGMTLRDYFAAKAMQALLADNQASDQLIARYAYDQADAMLKARKS